MSRKICALCSKKINHVDAIVSLCRCGKIFCISHRIDHKCEYDYKKEYKKCNGLVKVVVEKVSKI